MRLPVPPAVVLLLLLLLAPVTLRAQGPGGEAPAPTTDTRHTESIRPVVVGVDFEGNEGVSAGTIASRIQTKPTQPTFVQRFFETFARISDIKPLRFLFTRRYRAAMHRVLDSITGDVRYLNLTVIAADTVKIRNLYEDFGYHDAAVKYRVSMDTARNQARVHFLITEGKRYPLNGVHYLGIEDVPDEIRKEIETPELITLGEGYNKDDLTAERDRVLQLLKNSGYAFASSNLISVFQIREGRPGVPYDSALVSIYPGNRYRFGRTAHTIDSTGHGREVDSATIFRQIDWREGEWYSAQKVEQTSSNLYALGTFEVVRVDTSTTLTHGDTLGMHITTRLRPLHEIQVAPEVSFEKRASDAYFFTGASGSYSVMNPFGGAERLGVTGRLLFRIPDLGELQWGSAVNYYAPSVASFPIIGSNQLSLYLSGGYDFAIEDRITGVTLDQDVTLKSQRATVILPELTYQFPKYTYINRLTFRLFGQATRYLGIAKYITELARLRLAESDVAKLCTDTASAISEIADLLRDNIYRIQVLQGDDIDLVTDPTARDAFSALKFSTQFSVAATADHRNDIFTPTDGDFADIRLEGGVTGLFNGGFTKINFDYRRYMPSGNQSSWAARAHVGWIFEFGRLPLTPISSRFSAGGAYSIRGWDPREMLVTSTPTPDIQAACVEPIVKDVLSEGRRLLGGLGLIELMGEYRWNPFNLDESSAIKRQLNNIGFIFFSDIGNAYFRDYKQDSAYIGSVGNVFKTIVTNLGWAVGFSLGYNTPIGPFRVGIGYPLYDPVNLDLSGSERWFWNRGFRASDLAVHLALGHAF